MCIRDRISRVDNYTKPEEACRIGDAFDRHALIEFLAKLSGGTQYREFLFAYLTYADESHVESIIRDIRVRRKGKARDKYRAENFTGALYIKMCIRDRVNIALVIWGKYYRKNQPIRCMA